jgi:hypothetical protein
MALIDNEPGWAGYPGISQEIGTKISPVRLSRADRTSDGGFRVTRPSTIQGVEIVVVHTPITRAEADQLQDYYEASLSNKFQFQYHGTEKLYDCAFISQPEELWLGPGVDGTGVWKVTSKLTGTYSGA